MVFSGGATEVKGCPAQVKGERPMDLESRLQVALRGQLEAAEEKKKTAGERLRPTRISKDLTSTLEQLWAQSQKKRGGSIGSGGGPQPLPRSSRPMSRPQQARSLDPHEEEPEQSRELAGKLQRVTDAVLPARPKREVPSDPAARELYPHQVSQGSHISSGQSPAATAARDNTTPESSSLVSDQSMRTSPSLGSGAPSSGAACAVRVLPAGGAASDAGRAGGVSHCDPGAVEGQAGKSSSSSLSPTFDQLQDIVPGGGGGPGGPIGQDLGLAPSRAAEAGGKPSSSGEINSLLSEVADAPQDWVADSATREWLDKMLEMEPVPASLDFGDEQFFDGLDGLDQAFEDFAELLPQGLDAATSSGECNSGGNGRVKPPRADISNAGAVTAVHAPPDHVKVEEEVDWPEDLQQHTLPAYIQEARERKRKRKRTSSLQPSAPGSPGSVDVAGGKEHGDPLALLLAVAQALVAGDQPRLRQLLFELNEVASAVGSAMQRLSAYFLQGLLARMAGGPRPAPVEQPPLSDDEDLAVGEHVMRAFTTLIHSSPYLVFGQVACNSAILEAFKGYPRVHIVDYGIGHGIQWPSLIQALATREGGPPHLHITGIDLPAPSGVSRANCCINAGHRLTAVAAQWGVPLTYDALPLKLEDMRVEHVDVVEGEVVAVNCALRLHQLVDDSVSPSNALALSNVLHTVRDLQPDIVTVVEPHADHASPLFLARFYEALHYYATLFEEIGESLPADSQDRRAYEQQVLGRAILNVVACEGQARAERLEPLGHWQSRIRKEGFVPRPLGGNVLRTVSALLKTYREEYKMEGTENSLVLHWKGRPLLAMSSWRPDAS